MLLKLIKITLVYLLFFYFTITVYTCRTILENKIKIFYLYQLHNHYISHVYKVKKRWKKMIRKSPIKTITVNTNISGFVKVKAYRWQFCS